LQIKKVSLNLKSSLLNQYFPIAFQFLTGYCGFEIEMKGIPDKFEKEIETLIWDFIWEGKVNQIKRDVCCLDIENGGKESFLLFQTCTQFFILSIMSFQILSLSTL
jgi:hypothetical protein